MNALLRETLLHLLRARLWWYRLAEQQMNKTHHDLPTVLRAQWDLRQRIKELEDERPAF